MDVFIPKVQIARHLYFSYPALTSAHLAQLPDLYHNKLWADWNGKQKSKSLDLLTIWIYSCGHSPSGAHCSTQHRHVLSCDWLLYPQTENLQMRISEFLLTALLLCCSCYEHSIRLNMWLFLRFMCKKYLSKSCTASRWGWNGRNSEAIY